MKQVYRLGLASYSFHRALIAGSIDTPGLVRLAAESGCRVLEFDPFTAEADRSSVIWRDLLRGLEIEPLPKVNALGSHPLTVEAEAAAGMLSLMRERFTVARAMGARIVRMAARADRHPADWTKARRDLVLRRNLSELARMAGEAGLTIGLENHGDLRAAEILSLLADVGSPHLRLTVDVANAGILFEDPLAAARAMLPYAVSAHLKNYRAVQYPDGFRLTCSRPRQGIIDFDALLAVLDEVRPERETVLLIEAHVEADLDEEEVFREYLAEVRRSPLAPAD